MALTVTPDKVVSIVKTIAWDSLVKVSLAALYVAVPWLGPLSFLITPVVTLFADKLYNFLGEEAIEGWIDGENTGRRVALDRSDANLAAIARDKGIDSPEYQAAHKQEKADFENLIHFTSASRTA